MNYIILTLLILLVVAQCIIFGIRPVYCYLFERELWEAWKSYIARADEFEYHDSVGISHDFKIPGTEIEADVWKDSNLCSIHTPDGCICTFDSYHSKKMAKLLMDKINKQ